MATLTSTGSSASTILPSASFAHNNPADKYRGAVVEDLQLQPAFALPNSEPIARAIELAYDRDFSHIPVLGKNKKPLGYVDVAELKKLWEAGKADPADRVYKYMIRFDRSASADPYTVITPVTPLAELEGFLSNNIFALVTDVSRKFVLAVATSQDLETFIKRCT